MDQQHNRKLRTYKAAQRVAMILAKHGDALTRGQPFSPSLQPCAEGHMSSVATLHHVATDPDVAMAMLLAELEDTCRKRGLDLPPEEE